MGEAACWRWAARWAARRLEHRHVALRARGAAAARLSVGELLLPELAARRWSNLLVERAWSADEVEGRPCAATRRSRSSAAVRADRRRQRCIARGRPSATPTTHAEFKPGDRVRARNIHPATHTRLPRYVRGHVGVDRARSRLPRVPGSASHRARARTRNGSTRCVFDGRELWGADADPTVKVSIDAFEPYLEPA